MIGSLNVKVSVRAWVYLYLSMLKVFCFITGLKPDFEKVSGFIARYGIKTEVV